jgi:acetyltransferase-like isoleucine patch superfamily enzyme
VNQSNELKQLTRKQKLAVRLYLVSMRLDGMWALALRRHLITVITGDKHAELNIFANVFIEGFEGLSIGKHVSINRDCNLSCVGGVVIGDYVAIGHGTSIMSTNHGFHNPKTPIKYQPVEKQSVHIGRNVWIGARVAILAGVSIAEGTVVAAGAVVTRSITEPDMIVAGVPAKAIKSRLA